MDEEDYDTYQDYYDDYYEEEVKECEMPAIMNLKRRSSLMVFCSTPFYTVVNEATVAKERLHDIKALQSDFGLPENSSIRALKLCAWNLKKAKTLVLDDPAFLSAIETPIEPKPTTPTLLCPVCFQEYDPLKNGYALPCNHYLCRNCYADHINSEFDSKGKEAVDLKCPMPGCPHLILDSTFELFLPPAKYQKYTCYAIKSYVDTSFNLKWCPNPKCSNIIKFKDSADKTKVKNVTCYCGYVFCSSCSNEGHRPLSCDGMRKWKDLITGKYSDICDKWIKMNTKRCPTPSCNVPIQKNDGCMHMTCKNCNYEFCWLCLGDWKIHGEKTGGFYKCNIYVESDDPEIKKTDMDLKKYSFYSERYFEHLKSVKKAEEKKVIALNNFKSLCKRLNIKDNDDTFLQTALDGIIESRRLVSYTYPLAYFTEFTKEDFKEIFEFQQGELERHLEKLDRLTDDMKTLVKGRFDTPPDLFKFRESVKELCVTLGDYFSNMMDYFSNSFLREVETSVQNSIQRQKSRASEKFIKMVEDVEPRHHPPTPNPKEIHKESISEMEEEIPLEKMKEIAEEDEELRWRCPQCTYDNNAALDNCWMCKYRRESSKV